MLYSRLRKKFQIERENFLPGTRKFEIEKVQFARDQNFIFEMEKKVPGRERKIFARDQKVRDRECTVHERLTNLYSKWRKKFEMKKEKFSPVTKKVRDRES